MSHGIRRRMGRGRRRALVVALVVLSVAAVAAAQGAPPSHTLTDAAAFDT